VLLLQFLRISLLDVQRLPPLIARTPHPGTRKVDAAIQAAFSTPTKRTVPHNSRVRSNRVRRDPPPESPPTPTTPTAGPSHHRPQRGLRGRGVRFTTRGEFHTRNSRPSTPTPETPTPSANRSTRRERDGPPPYLDSSRDSRPLFLMTRNFFESSGHSNTPTGRCLSCRNASPHTQQTCRALRDTLPEHSSLTHLNPPRESQTSSASRRNSPPPFSAADNAARRPSSMLPRDTGSMLPEERSWVHGLDPPLTPPPFARNAERPDTQPSIASTTPARNVSIFDPDISSTPVRSRSNGTESSASMRTVAILDITPSIVQSTYVDDASRPSESVQPDANPSSPPGNSPINDFLGNPESRQRALRRIIGQVRRQNSQNDGRSPPPPEDDPGKS
jgi:hypothetical protein